jgi:hypothetical protein
VATVSGLARTPQGGPRDTMIWELRADAASGSPNAG